MKNKKIKILMYHSIRPYSHGEDGIGMYSVPIEKFRKQMEFVRRTAYGEQRKNIAITFDDGYVDNYTCAFPVLKELGIKAHFFILAAKIGTTGYMNWEQLKELKEAGMTIGSHGMQHKILTELNNAELEYELAISKKFLESKLEHGIDFFSVPKGHYNKQVIDKARETGYKGIFTSDLRDVDSFIFGRIAVRGEWDLDYFIQVLNNGLSFKDKAKDFAKSSSKKILGVDYYDRIREKILRKVRV